MFKKRWLIFVVILFSFSFVNAAPQIDSYFGEFSHGQYVAIEGLDFGSKDFDNPWYWEDFEDGDANLNMETSPGVYDPIISSDDAYAGSQSLKCQLGDGTPLTSSGRQGYAIYNFPHEMIPGEKLFVRFWTLHSWVCESHWTDEVQIKPWRIVAGDPNSPVTPNPGEPTLTVSIWPNCQNTANLTPALTGYHSVYGDFTDYFSRDFAPEPATPNNEWILFEAELRQDTPLIDDGEFKAWISRLGESRMVSNYPNVVMRSVEGRPGYSKLTLGYWIGNNPLGDDETVTIYYDDLYVDNSWSRVVLCDSPNYEDCSFREIQIPTYWTDNQITFEVNTGNLLEGSAYLYVIDENGVVGDSFGPVQIQNDPPQGCLVNSDCNDNNQCTFDFCNAEGSCINPITSGASCDDGIECTTNDFCFVDGTCSSTTLNDGLCSDNSDCDVKKCTQGGCEYTKCLGFKTPEKLDIKYSPTFTYEYLTFYDLFKIKEN